MSRSLHVVTGKGGVGTSTIAGAIAIAAAARGLRVLAVELGVPAGLARILAPAPPGVSVASFEGAAALAEYLTRKVRLGRLGRRVLSHPLYHAFVGAAPGLRELMAVGKVRDELVLQARWDVVVVDGGASGHALEHLRMPAAAARAFSAGRVHREAEANAALLRDPQTTAVHVVALPEEMPVREAIQIVAALRELSLPIGALLVNQCRPVAPAGIDEAVAALGRSPVAEVARRARGWERIQESAIAVLEDATRSRVVRLPRRWTSPAFQLAGPVGEAVL